MPYFLFGLFFCGTLSIQFLSENTDLFAGLFSAEDKKSKIYEMAFKNSDFSGKQYFFKDKEMIAKNIKFSTKELMNKTVILNFWGHWCAPCLEEFPSLIKLNGMFSQSELEIIAINTDESDQLKKVSKMIKQYQLDFPIVYDQKSKITELFQVSAIPVSILFHKGKYVESYDGGVDFTSIEFINKIKELKKTK